MQQGPQVELKGSLQARAGGLLDLHFVNRAITRGQLSRPACGPISHAAKPGCERAVHPNRTRLPHQDEKRSLERVVRVVMIPEDLAAHPHYHRPVAIDELTKRRFGQGVPTPKRRFVSSSIAT